jgi:hypothetical protein
MDAREWLDAGTQQQPRLLWEFDADDTKYIVGNIYAMGADDVSVLGDAESLAGRGSADILLIQLPEDMESRAGLFEFAAQVAKECGFMDPVDDGQTQLLIRWT